MEYLNDDGSRIKVIGVGGGGINAVNHMIAANLQRVEFIAADTDTHRLTTTRAKHSILLGEKLTRGISAGGQPEIGRQAAEESLPAIKAAIGEAGLVFVVAGMGFGTGTGAAPVIAKAAKETGALTIGVASKPFHFEGKSRLTIAEQGITDFLQSADSVIIIPNDRLILQSIKKNLPDLLKSGDEAIHLAVRGISDLCVYDGLIALDFADVESILQGKGFAALGFGFASGESRARDAAMQAISMPLLEDVSIAQANGLLINITSNEDITIEEISEVASIFKDKAHEDAKIFFGTVFDDSMGDELCITVLASGYNYAAIQQQRTELQRKNDIVARKELHDYLCKLRRHSYSQMTPRQRSS